MSTPSYAVRIRLARPSDLRHLAAVEDSGAPLFEELFGAALAPVLVEPARSGRDRDLDGIFLLVAEETGSGTVVGFAHVREVEGHAHLEQLSVRPEHGRRGTGAALVAAAEEEARWLGYDELSLCTYREVPWNGPFYRRLGYREAGPLAPWQQRLHDHEVELGLDVNGVRVVMARPLRRR
ncbi:GNAT family N-acetyltransferase [Nocardioides panaciterrulae]|uniref:GNAT superfamily N-acetyltransferase n=1 Tax=Nocardioides panaciterrulae TaxID=661492 RepID=A0A7Y9JA17_9ACTN|nr:GNAT superfamily N-acetyltransferase [Nocardioides panaciterrulae]